MKTSKYTAILLILLVMVLGSACSGNSNGRRGTVVKGPFYIKVQALGHLQSANSINIGCPSIHRVWQYTISFMAPEGKEVNTGETILKFDARQLQEQLLLKQSDLETAKKELEKNKLLEQEKKENLELQLEEAKVAEEKAGRKLNQPEEFMARNEVKKMRMDYELAVLQKKLTKSRIKNQTLGMKTRILTYRNKIKRLEKEVARLQDGIAKMNVKAPKPGIVVYAQDWNGKKKAVGDRCWFGENVIELPDLNQMQVKAAIPESQASKVKPNLAVDIRLDSSPDRVFKGNVDSLGRIFRSKSYDQPVIVFDAIISIEEPDPELMRPGMAATVDIIVSSKTDVLQVPESAIIYDEKGLFVMKEGFMSQTMTPVTVGARSGGVVEILEGLKENDSIIISNENIENGDEG